MVYGGNGGNSEFGDKVSEGDTAIKEIIRDIFEKKMHLVSALFLGNSIFWS